MSPIGLHNVLDVTLRDGGYLNQWQFSETEIHQFIQLIHQLGLRHIEIGFLRSENKSSTMINGCPIKFLATLHQEYPDIHWVAMLNPADDDWQIAVQEKLPYLSLIRLTCTEDLIDRALAIADYLHDYATSLHTTIHVSINLICISAYHHTEIATLLARINTSAAVDRVYFADSRGAVLPEEIPSLMTLAQQSCEKPMGFHAHNTLGHAIENSNRAFAQGCDLIDVSLNGFGLAGGNTPLVAYLAEHQLIDMTQTLDAQAFCESVFPLSIADMGDQALYRMLAKKNIDPIWSNALVKHYPFDLSEKIKRLPRQPYKTLNDVLLACST